MVVIVDQFYQIRPKDTNDVSPRWKRWHFTLFTTSVICGLVVVYSFGETKRRFDGRCILDAKIVFRNDTELFPVTNENGTMKYAREIDVTHSKWHSTSYCDFCQFTALASMIIAGLLGTFTLFYAKGGAGYFSDSVEKPWTIVYPFLFVSFIFTCIYLASVVVMSKGFSNFCKEFSEELFTEGCRGVNKYKLQFGDVTGHRVHNFLVMYWVTYTFAYLGLAAWVMQIIVLFLRILCVVDFSIYLVTISLKEDEVEFDDEVLSQASDMHTETLQ